MGRNNPPTAQQVQDALNDLPAMAALNRPISVSSTTDSLGGATYSVTFGRNEIQRLNFFGTTTGAAVGGTFTLTVGSVTTDPIAYPTPFNAITLASNIQSPLAAKSIQTTVVPVAGATIPQFDITFTTDFTDQPQITANTGTLTGGASPRPCP